MDIIVNYCLPTAFRERRSDQRAFSGEAKAKQVCSQAGNEDLRWKRVVDENTKVFMINIDKWNANGFYHVSIYIMDLKKRGNTLGLLFIASCETDVRC